MIVDISIKCTATGVVRSFQEDWDSMGDCEYMYRIGNYACDCNRYLFFERAGGVDPDWELAECGEGAYSVSVSHNGSRIFSDMGADRSSTDRGEQ